MTNNFKFKKMKKRLFKTLLFIPAVIATMILLPVVSVYWIVTGKLFKPPIEILLNL